MKRALTHPKRAEILACLMQKMVLGGEGADEVELADALSLTRTKVRYHLTVLADADLISPADDSRPGAPERYVAPLPAGK